MKLFAVIFIICMMFPLCRCIVKNLHLIGIYTVVDAYLYVKFKRWQEFDLFGIDLFIYRHVRSWKNSIYDSQGSAYI